MSEHTWCYSSEQFNETILFEYGSEGIVYRVVFGLMIDGWLLVANFVSIRQDGAVDAIDDG